MKVAPYVPAVVAVTVQVQRAMLFVEDPLLAVGDNDVEVQVFPEPPVPLSAQTHVVTVVPDDAPVPVLLVVNFVPVVTVIV